MSLLNHKILGEKEPLVILHGLFGSLDNWVTLGKKFSERFQVILVDQRNHGHSFHDSIFNYKSMADDLEELLDHLSLDCINLIGHSMGGKTAMTFANSNPDRISRLVVADIGPKLYPVHHQEIIDAFYSVPINSIKSRKEADELLQPKVVKFGVRQFLLKNLARTSGGFEWKMNLDTISNNISEVGASTFPNTVLDIETLFIRGSKSNYILDDDLEGIKASYSSAQFETIIGAGHWLHAECPKEFFLASYDFLTLPS